MNNDRFLTMLGLCRRAGKTVIGTPMVTKSLTSGDIKLVIYANDASENTEKRVKDKCTFYGVEHIKVNRTADELAHAIGKSGAVCAVGITDGNFSKELKSLISNEER